MTTIFDRDKKRAIDWGKVCEVAAAITFVVGGVTAVAEAIKAIVEAREALRARSHRRQSAGDEGRSNTEKRDQAPSGGVSGPAEGDL